LQSKQQTQIVEILLKNQIPGVGKDSPELS